MFNACREWPKTQLIGVLDNDSDHNVYECKGKRFDTRMSNARLYLG